MNDGAERSAAVEKSNKNNNSNNNISAAVFASTDVHVFEQQTRLKELKLFGVMRSPDKCVGIETQDETSDRQRIKWL